MSYIEEKGPLHLASQLVILDDLSDIFSDNCRLLLYISPDLFDRLIQRAYLLASCIPARLSLLDGSVHVGEQLGCPGLRIRLLLREV